MLPSAHAAAGRRARPAEEVGGPRLWEWLRGDAKLEVQRVREKQGLDLALRVLGMENAPCETVGDGKVFNCVYHVEPENRRQSVWILRFYEDVTFAVSTI